MSPSRRSSAQCLRHLMPTVHGAAESGPELGGDVDRFRARPAVGAPIRGYGETWVTAAHCPGSISSIALIRPFFWPGRMGTYPTAWQPKSKATRCPPGATAPRRDPALAAAVGGGESSRRRAIAARRHVARLVARHACGTGGLARRAGAGALPRGHPRSATRRCAPGTDLDVAFDLTGIVAAYVEMAAGDGRGIAV